MSFVLADDVVAAAVGIFQGKFVGQGIPVNFLRRVPDPYQFRQIIAQVQVFQKAPHGVFVAALDNPFIFRAVEQLVPGDFFGEGLGICQVERPSHGNPVINFRNTLGSQEHIGGTLELPPHPIGEIALGGHHHVVIADF